MEKEFDRVLDECIERISNGASLESCLRDYPEYSGQLAPLLRAMAETRRAYAFKPSDDAQRAGRLRLYNALEKRRRPSFWQKLSAKRAVWATVAGVLVVAIVAYAAVRTIGLPGNEPGGNIAQPTPVTTTPITGTPEPVSQYIASADPAGNFAFLVSDEVNAIADFSSISVTIDRVGLLQEGPDGRWQEFVPETREFDLSLLPGDKTQELWRGNVPEGRYSKVFIAVSRVAGVLKSSGETVDIKVPSNKLQLSLPFEVSPASVTSFIYDLTVVHTGNGQDKGKYQLKPQIGESGASQKPSQKINQDQITTTSPDIMAIAPVINSRKL